MTPHILDTIASDILGERLMEARRARGLTQQMVAGELGVARTTITAIEKGARRPRAAELVALARLYGRQVGDLVQPARSSREPGFAAQLQPASGARAVADAADIQRFEDFCRWYVELEEMLGAPLPRRYPDPYDISDTNPERAAEEVAESEHNRLGLGDGPIGDLQGILETDVGLRIFALPLANSRVAGMFLFSEDYGGCVAVNANHLEERRCWSMAHEYAHFLTTRFRPEITVLEGYRRVPESERFADAFARHFLMPGAGLIRRFQAMRRTKDAPLTPADILTLSALYRVSFQAMIWRLEELKMLPAGTWERLQARGFKPAEAQRIVGIPRAESGLTLLPRRYEMLAAQAYARALLTEGQLAQRLATDRVDAQRRVRDLSEERELSPDGKWRQVPFDLNAALVGTS
jgi:Zn-dependent peptidase ImmA (M78 family)/DNA-binding XRE family transcriptional regulator